LFDIFLLGKEYDIIVSKVFKKVNYYLLKHSAG